MSPCHLAPWGTREGTVGGTLQQGLRGFTEHVCGERSKPRKVCWAGGIHTSTQEESNERELCTESKRLMGRGMKAQT